MNMTQHWSEGVGALRFTAREFHQELIQSAKYRNTLAAPSKNAASFVALKLLQEMAYQTRGPDSKKTVILCTGPRMKILALEISLLTDLKVFSCDSEESLPCKDIIKKHQVLIFTPQILNLLLEQNILKISIINLLIIERCHMIATDFSLQNIIKYYNKWKKKLNDDFSMPRILAFTHVLFAQKSSNEELPSIDSLKLNLPNNEYKTVDDVLIDRRSNKMDSMTDFNYWRTEIEDIIEDKISTNAISQADVAAKRNDFLKNIHEKELGIDTSQKSSYERVEYQLERLENMLNCKIDTAADVVGLKKITGKPKEIILEHGLLVESEKCDDRRKLEGFMKVTVMNALNFLDDHRYDPTEIYGDDAFSDELKNIPDPCIDPRTMLHQYLYILEQAGPYAADKAAYALLEKIEKLKVKIPYERHFLLLCMVSSLLIQLRAFADLIFEKYPNDIEKIELFTSPKVLRLITLLKLFIPNENFEQAESINSPKKQIKHGPETDLKNKAINDDSKTTCDKQPLSNGASQLDVKSNVEEVTKHNNEEEEILSVINEFKPTEVLEVIDKCNFKTLGDKIEEKCEEILQNKIDNNKPVIKRKRSRRNRHNRKSKFITKDNKIAQAQNETLENVIVEVKTETINEIEVVSNDNKKENEINKVAETEIQNKPIENIIQVAETPNVSPRRRVPEGRGKYRKQGKHHYHQNKPNNVSEDDLCGLVFVNQPLMAKILCSLINEYCRADSTLSFVSAQYTMDKVADVQTEIKEAEIEHRIQEDVLKKFRIHECNLLIGTAVLEEGIDLPKCNLVVRWDPPNGYRSHARCRARARAPRSLYVLMAPISPTELVSELAHYGHIERMLVRKCNWNEPGPSEEAHAAMFTSIIEPYRPSTHAATLSSAVQLLNRYCAKLPSDTFTRLVPQWTMEEICYKGNRLYVCAIRLPTNCPLKYQIVGHPMPTRVLARRIAALQVCRALHQAGELDENLLPIGKESFRATESDWLSLPPNSDLQMNSDGILEPRPGTTKRKQYYYKKVATALSNCRPEKGVPCFVYAICAKLACPLPEKHNTRGRKLHPPELYDQGFAILTSKPLHQIPKFPLFTRSGEVTVKLQKLDMDVILSPRRIKYIHNFMQYTFAEVLRVRNHLMVFDACGQQARNSYYVVPTTRICDDDENTKIIVDWDFLELIYKHSKEFKNLSMNRKLKPNLFDGSDSQKKEELKKIEDFKNILQSAAEENNEKNDENETDNVEIKIHLPNPCLTPGETFQFDSEKYKDAVVMPWYRNQDQPQYFYVAEICWQLSPKSAFPSTQHATFEDYYKSKYGVVITQTTQPLLDVDHTSARLNLLTPRFVNRKGVALPTSSERTKRAKRESLQQKQILVPELCRTHPFRGALWRAAVALPCILYRINSLLLADEIRRSVALRVALGHPKPLTDFEWPALDFGWSLADVLASENAKDEKTADEEAAKATEVENKPSDEEIKKEEPEKENEEKTANELFQEKEDASDDSAFEIGTWSNDMASNVPDIINQEYDDEDLYNTKLPGNVSICTSKFGADWSLADINPSPKHQTRQNHQRKYSVADSDVSYVSSDFEPSDVDSNFSDSESDDMEVVDKTSSSPDKSGIRIEFKSGNEAEAIDITPTPTVNSISEEDMIADKLAEEESLKFFQQYFYSHDNDDHNSEDMENLKNHVNNFHKAIAANEVDIVKNGMLIPYDQSVESLKLNDSQIANDKTSNPYEKTKFDIEKYNEQFFNEIDEDKSNPFPEEYDSVLSKEQLLELYDEMFPLDADEQLEESNSFFSKGLLKNGVVSLEDLEKNKRKIFNHIRNTLPKEEWRKYNFFAMKDLNDDEFEKSYEDLTSKEKVIQNEINNMEEFPNECPIANFSFDYQPDLKNHPGPSPSIILQALTMSNANDGINLERLETIGDSFLKYAITTYLYCTYQNIHEGKLSHLRSKQVSNLNLYRLGRKKFLGCRMVACKFEPHDNWLPPCHRVPPHLETALIDTHVPSTLWNIANIPPLNNLSKEEVERLVRENVLQQHTKPSELRNELENDLAIIKGNRIAESLLDDDFHNKKMNTNGPCFIPYNLITQHSIPDKSIADCVEALIGAYLIECGPRGALLFMAWLGIRVLPKEEVVLDPQHPFVKKTQEAQTNKGSEITTAVPKSDNLDIDLSENVDECDDYFKEIQDEFYEIDPYETQETSSDFDEEDEWNYEDKVPGSLKPVQNENGEWIQIIYGELKAPPSPLLRFVPDPEGELAEMLSGYEELERTLHYRFKDKCYLLQAMTHASYSPNRLTDCYQRLEFLGDAVLDYLITRHLYEDPRRHSPGALTDLRSALVNNTIFASLTVRHGMHKYFRHLSPGLNEVLTRFVRIQEENGHNISEEHYLIQEDECEQAEDVEVPKALGDLFESVAGAIFLDSGMSLDAVWKVYYRLMQREIEAFSESVPKSPVRELLEMEPETAKFGKPEKLADGRRVRVTVEVLGAGAFKGVGRNYRIAKCTAAKCALRHLAGKPKRQNNL